MTIRNKKNTMKRSAVKYSIFTRPLVSERIQFDPKLMCSCGSEIILENYTNKKTNDHIMTLARCVNAKCPEGNETGVEFNDQETFFKELERETGVNYRVIK